MIEKKTIQLTYTVYDLPDGANVLAYSALEAVRTTHMRSITTDPIERPFLALVAPERYTEIQCKFSTQQRFTPILVGREYGLNWSGILVLPSDLVTVSQIAFVPMLTSLSLVSL